MACPPLSNLTTLRSLFMKIPILLVVFLLAVSASLRAEGPQDWFRKDSRWVLIGDSITHDGRYVEYVKLFLATRFPDRGITLINAGISGDSVGGALRRYEWDIAPARANEATIMLGMNDVGRDNYKEGEPSEETLSRRKASLDGYRKNLTDLIARLKADDIRITLVTPSPYDDTAKLGTPNLPGCNAGLASVSEIVREVGQQAGVPVIDLHTPMTALNLEKQQAEPAFTLIGNDRVHPGPEGHMVMATLLLKGLDAPQVVSDVSVDAASLQVARSENADTSKPTKTTDGHLEFRIHSHALPFPLSAQFTGGMALAGFSDALNIERLQITGLAPGEYQLRIDGSDIAVFSAEELVAGIRLDGLKNTPQMKQSIHVAALVSKWFERIRTGLRTIAMVEHGLLKDIPHPVAFADAESRVCEKLAAEPDPNAYMARVYQRYLDEKPKEAATHDEIAALENEIHLAAKPQERFYSIFRK